MIHIPDEVVEAAAKAAHADGENFIASFESGLRVESWDALTPEDKKIYLDDARLILTAALKAWTATGMAETCEHFVFTEGVHKFGNGEDDAPTVIIIRTT